MVAWHHPEAGAPHTRAGTLLGELPLDTSIRYGFETTAPKNVTLQTIEDAEKRIYAHLKKNHH